MKGFVFRAPGLRSFLGMFPLRIMVPPIIIPTKDS